MSKASFIHNLYLDQLEALSFLYGQRIALFSNPEVSWKTIHKFEARLEANLDALVTGGEPALEVCLQQAKDGDPGDLYAALRVFCKLERKDLLIELLEGIDSEDTEKHQAFIDALKHGLPEAWQDNILEPLDSKDPQLCDMSASVAAYRRLSAGKSLVQTLKRYSSSQVILALGHLRERSAASLLLPNLRHDDEAVCSAAALALLRIGDMTVIPHCQRIAGESSWSHIPLSLGGDRSAVSTLAKVAGSDNATADTVLALGILGDITVIDLLLEKLDGDLAEPAAQALDLITGANLCERVFVPDDVEEDDLLDDEKEAFRQGKLPCKPDGSLYGAYVNRLSQSRPDWSVWWGENKARFGQQIRYRLGRVYSPLTILETLRSEKSPFRLRQLAYEELVIRYDVDFPFEADQFVSEQMRVLDSMAQWIAANSGRFQDGAWYFAGRIVS